MKQDKPDCYQCVHRIEIPGDAHSRCNNHDAKVKGHPHGIRRGWFLWPVNFDPVWLLSCDGFTDDPAERMPRKSLDPITELFGILKK